MATEFSLLKSGRASNSTAATGGRRDAAKTQTRTSNKGERAGPSTLSKPCSLLPDPYQQSLTQSQVAKEDCLWFEEHSLRKLRNEAVQPVQSRPSSGSPPCELLLLMPSTHTGDHGEAIIGAVRSGLSSGRWMLCWPNYQYLHGMAMVTFQLRSGRREERFKQCIW